MVIEAIPSPGAEAVGQPADELSRLSDILLARGALDNRTLDRARRVAADTGGRLERAASRAAGVYPKLAAPLHRRGPEQAGQPPGAVAGQAEQQQPAAVPVPGQAGRRVGAARAQQEAGPDERASHRLPAVASECRRRRSVTLLPARCCRASSRSTPG